MVVDRLAGDQTLDHPHRLRHLGQRPGLAPDDAQRRIAPPDAADGARAVGVVQRRRRSRRAPSSRAKPGLVTIGTDDDPLGLGEDPGEDDERLLPQDVRVEHPHVRETVRLGPLGELDHAPRPEDWSAVRRRSPSVPSPVRTSAGSCVIGRRGALRSRAGRQRIKARCPPPPRTIGSRPLQVSGAFPLAPARVVHGARCRAAATLSVRVQAGRERKRRNVMSFDHADGCSPPHALSRGARVVSCRARARWRPRPVGARTARVRARRGSARGRSRRRSPRGRPARSPTA